MTHGELKSLLEQTGLPVAYYAFKEQKTPPFLAFFRENSAPIAADNRVWASQSDYRIELYTDKKDVELEARLSGLLDKNDIYYEVSETYIEAERLYLVTFGITV